MSLTDGSGDVLVTNTERFHTSVGVAIRSKDMSSNPPQILVQTGSGFTQVTGAPHAGGYRFTGVPQGEFYLKTGNTYVITDERHIEVGTDRLGREDTVFSSQYDVPVSLSLTNLSPWQDRVAYTAAAGSSSSRGNWMSRRMWTSTHTSRQDKRSSAMHLGMPTTCPTPSLHSNTGREIACM